MMTRLIVLVMAIAPVLAHADNDQPGSGAGSATPTEPTPPTDAASIAALRKTCTDAMNADKEFAKKIVAVADENAVKTREDATRQAHVDAEMHVAKNERHVIYAYSAIWVIAALFVVFLWRRQVRLTAEIIQLRRDLTAATKSADPIEPVPSK